MTIQQQLNLRPLAETLESSSSIGRNDYSSLLLPPCTSGEIQLADAGLPPARQPGASGSATIPASVDPFIAENRSVINQLRVAHPELSESQLASGLRERGTLDEQTFNAILSRWERHGELSFAEAKTVHQAVEGFITEYNKKDCSHETLREILGTVIPDTEGNDRSLLQVLDSEVRHDVNRITVYQSWRVLRTVHKDYCVYRDEIRSNGIMGGVMARLNFHFDYSAGERNDYARLFYGGEFADPLYNLYYQTHGRTVESQAQLQRYVEQIVAPDGGQPSPELQQQARHAWDMIYGPAYRDSNPLDWGFILSWDLLGNNGYVDRSYYDQIGEMVNLEFTGTHRANVRSLLGLD